MDYGLEETEILDWINYFGNRQANFWKTYTQTLTQMLTRSEMALTQPRWGWLTSHNYSQCGEKEFEVLWHSSEDKIEDLRRCHGLRTCWTSWRIAWRSQASCTEGGERWLMKSLPNHRGRRERRTWNAQNPAQLKHEEQTAKQLCNPEPILNDQVELKWLNLPFMAFKNLSKKTIPVKLKYRN